MEAYILARRDFQRDVLLLEVYFSQIGLEDAVLHSLFLKIHNIY